MAQGIQQLKGCLVGPRIQAGLLRATPAGLEGKVATNVFIEDLVRRELKLAPHHIVYLGDSNYYLPTQQEIQTILSASQVDRHKWISDKFDCDDFAYALKGEMSTHAYETTDLKYGLCVGIVWGNFDWVEGYHAINWCITSEEKLLLIEPQNDNFYPSSHCTDGVSLLLV